MKLVMKCCFTSTETIGLLGMGDQDSHLDFQTAPELCNEVMGQVEDELQYLICKQLESLCVKMNI